MKIVGFRVRGDSLLNFILVTLVSSLMLCAAAAAQDLHTSSFSSQDYVVAGTNITFEFSVFNDTGGAATNAELNITLPSKVTAVANNGLCTGTANVNCPLGNISDGGSKAVSVTLHVSDDYVATSFGGGFLAFSASATSDESPLSNTVFGDTPVTEVADLQIVNIAQNPLIHAGDITWYTIYVDNYGPSAARDVVINDTLLSTNDASSGEGDIVSVQSCAYSVSQGGGSITQFTCTTGPVVETQFGTGIGTFRTNTLRALANLADDPNTPEPNDPIVYGRLRAAFRITSDNEVILTSDTRVMSLTPDPVSSNNEQYEVFGFENASDLALEIDSSGELQPNGSTVLPYDLLSGTSFPDAGFNVSSIAVTSGRRVHYSYTVTNNGPSDADNSQLISRLPAGVVVVPGSLEITYGDGSPVSGNCQFGTPGLPSDEMTCGLGTIDADSQLPPLPAVATITGYNVRKITFDVMSDESLASGTVLVNNVLLGSDAVDEDNSNNLGSSLMVVSPITGVSGCSVGGAYTNVVCGNGSTILNLNGFGFALPDTGTLDVQWSTTCPDASFDDATSLTPQLSFTTANLDNTPVSCQVDLAVQNIYSSSTCNGVINVVDCQADCFGVLDGPAQLDRCGVCDGDGNSCLGCSNIDSSANVLSLNKAALTVRTSSLKAARQLSDDVAARKVRRAAKRAFLDNLEAISLIPTKVKSCTNANFCAQTNNVGILEAVNGGFDKAIEGARKAVKKLKVESGEKTAGKKLLKNALSAQSAAQNALVGVPLISSECS